MRWQVARVSGNLGSLLLQKRQTADEAGTHLHRAEALLRKLTAEFPTVAQYAQELASVEYNLGMLAMTTKKLDQAATSFKESTRLLEALKTSFSGSARLPDEAGLSQAALASSLGATTPADAEGSLRKALAEQSALVAQYRGVPEYQLELGRGHYQLGRFLLNSKPAAAIPEFEQAEGLYKDVLNAQTWRGAALKFVLENRMLLVHALIDAGRLPEAMTAAEQIPEFYPSEPKFYVHATVLLIHCAERRRTLRRGEGRLKTA